MPCWTVIKVEAKGFTSLEEIVQAAKALEVSYTQTGTSVTVTLEGRRMTFQKTAEDKVPWSREATPGDLKQLRQGKNIHETVQTLRRKGWSVRPKSRKVKGGKVEMIMVKA